MNYVSRRAYDRATGEDEGIVDAPEALGHDYPQDPEPTGESWELNDEAETRRRLPQLSAMFPPRE